jgi:hypothetical protein
MTVVKVPVETTVDVWDPYCVTAPLQVVLKTDDGLASAFNVISFPLDCDEFSFVLGFLKLFGFSVWLVTINPFRFLYFCLSWIS